MILKANDKAYSNFTPGKEYQAEPIDYKARDTHYVALVKQDDLGCEHYLTEQFMNDHFEVIGGEK